MEKLRVFSTRREHEKNEAYLADAIAALFGSILGVSTVATFAESTAGVADGAKTGGETAGVGSPLTVKRNLGFFLGG